MKIKTVVVAQKEELKFYLGGHQVVVTPDWMRGNRVTLRIRCPEQVQIEHGPKERRRSNDADDVK